MSRVPDDFYGGSIRKDLRRSPQTVVNLHKNLLRSNNFRVSKDNLNLVLSASRELYKLVGEAGSEELEEYGLMRSKEKQVRGPVVLHFDLVVAILYAIISYVRDHPKESLDSAAAILVIEQYLEQKLGSIGSKIWRKIVNDTSLRRHLAGLSHLDRRKKRVDYRDLR
jgi:hypothetical protein